MRRFPDGSIRKSRILVINTKIQCIYAALCKSVKFFYKTRHFFQSETSIRVSLSLFLIFQRFEHCVSYKKDSYKKVCTVISPVKLLNPIENAD